MNAFPWDKTCLWCGYVRRVHRKEDLRCPDPRSMDSKGWHHSNTFKAFPSSIPSDPENYQGPGDLPEEDHSILCQDTMPDRSQLSHDGFHAHELDAMLQSMTAERDELRSVIRATIGAIDSWKVPLLDPDGNDSSEAVMRFVADDLRRVLGMKTFDEVREDRRGR